MASTFVIVALPIVVLATATAVLFLATKKLSSSSSLKALTTGAGLVAIVLLGYAFLMALGVL